jgi:hypothetical protein
MGASLGCDAPRDSAGRELNSLRDPVLDVDEPIVKGKEGEIVRGSRSFCPLSWDLLFNVDPPPLPAGGGR